MRCIVLFVVTLIAMGGLLNPVRAEQEGDPSPKVTMDEVVVTASRQEEQVASVPAHITVIDAEAIEKTNAKNVPEVLATLPGVQVSDVGGNRRSYTVDLRGFGESAPANLLVLVDGRRINQADLSGTDWTLIPLERIERIEVIRGPRGGVLYGDNASGGVINIITKEGSGLEGTGSLQYGSYDTFKAVAGINGATGIFSYDFSGSYLTSDGYRDNSDTEAKDLGATLRLDPSDWVRLDLSGAYHEDETRLPGALKESDIAAGKEPTDTVNPDDFADVEDYYAKGGAEFFFLTNDAFNVDASIRNRSTMQYASFAGGWFSGDTEIETIIVSPHFTFQEQFGQVSNRLILGADFTRAEEDITNTSEYFGFLSTGIYELEKENWAWFVQDELGVTPNATISLGYRHDWVNYSFSPGPSDKKKYDEDAFNVGINYQVGGGQLYATYGNTFRYPLLDELFNFFNNTVNADLQPQNSRNLEVGAGVPMTEHTQMRLNVFYLETKDEIFYNPAAFTNENIDGDTLRNGFEVALGYNRWGWSAGANYRFTHTRIRGGQYDGNKVPNVPESLASADLGYTFASGLSGLFLGLNGIYVGDRFFISDFANAFEKQEDYVVVNAKAQYPWRWFTFFVDFNNIFDEQYASYGSLGGFPVERAFYPSPGFNVLAGITARFGRK